jgi:hypothetical protein
MSYPSDPTATPASTPAYSPPAPGGAMTPAFSGLPMAAGPVGKVRGTGGCILLAIVTFGIYCLYWYYKTHDEMKQHSGQGIGGGLALVLGIFFGIAMPFVSSNEVGDLYTRRGQARPVSAVTGLWAILLGWFFFLGSIVWFVKTNGALNAYWRSVGAR